MNRNPSTPWWNYATLAFDPRHDVTISKASNNCRWLPGTARVGARHRSTY